MLAVVISYNGLHQTKQAVDAVRPQVGQVHVVDNGSGAESQAVLEVLERQAGVTVERLGENLGLGCALNRGVQRARQMGCAWLLTMDQDSVAGEGMIKAYQAAIQRDPKLVSLSPRIAGSAENSHPGIYVIGSAITSGNLVKVSVFDEVGLYDESFFIDCVDFDFCVRLRQAGYSIHRVSAAVMHHQLGTAREIPAFLRRYYSEHSPLRRYYSSRNILYMMKRYWRRFPLFVLKLGTAHVVQLVLVALYDPAPMRSYRAVARGVRDYLARRQGPYLERAR